MRLTEIERSKLNMAMKVIYDQHLKFKGVSREFVGMSTWTYVNRGNLQLCMNGEGHGWWLRIIDGKEYIKIDDKDDGIWWDILRDDIPMFEQDIIQAYQEKVESILKHRAAEKRWKDNDLAKATRILNGNTKRVSRNKETLVVFMDSLALDD